MTTLVGAYLYRAYDEAGTLIYLGISLAAFRRLSNHEHNSGWWREARMITIIPFTNRAEAARAEIEAIRNEKPLYNSQHNENPVTPPIAPAHQGRALMKRLTKAGRRAAGVDDGNSFAARAEKAVAALRTPSDDENGEQR